MTDKSKLAGGPLYLVLADEAGRLYFFTPQGQLLHEFDAGGQWCADSTAGRSQGGVWALDPMRKARLLLLAYVRCRVEHTHPSSAQPMMTCSSGMHQDMLCRAMLLPQVCRPPSRPCRPTLSVTMRRIWRLDMLMAR